MNPPSAPGQAPASLGEADSRAHGVIVLTLPPVAPANPAPVPGTVVDLSSAARSISGRFGSAKIGPVRLGRGTKGCVRSSDGLKCTLQLRVPAGTRNLRLEAFSSLNGTGTPIASTSPAPVTVYARQRNVISPPAWWGIAATYKLTVTPDAFTQGRPGPANACFLAFDATRALIPTTLAIGTGGQAVRAMMTSNNTSLSAVESTNGMPPFTCGTVVYDGIAAGTAQLRDADFYNPRVTYATADVTLKPGPAGTPQLLVWSSGVPVNAPGFPQIVEFSASANGNAPPLRTIQVAAPPISADASGVFWAGPFGNFTDYQVTYLQQFTATGSEVRKLTGSLATLAAAADAQENIYAVQASPNVSCVLGGAALTVYSAASSWTQVSRAISYVPVGENCDISVAVDSKDNAYVGYNTSGIGGLPPGYLRIRADRER